MTTRRLRILRALFLSALLLVPALASGHHHATHPAAPCAACAVTHHTPVTMAPVVAAPAIAELVVGVRLVAVTQPRDPATRSATGRGPPAAVLSQEA
jgi:hypothetical protein